MMNSSGVGCAAFGILFGLILLSNTLNNKKYLLGLWNFKSKRKFIAMLLIYGICAGVAYIFAALSQYVAKASLLKYFLQCFAIEFASFNLVFFPPLLANKLKLIQYS